MELAIAATDVCKFKQQKANLEAVMVKLKVSVMSSAGDPGQCASCPDILETISAEIALDCMYK